MRYSRCIVSLRTTVGRIYPRRTLNAASRSLDRKLLWLVTQVWFTRTGWHRKSRRRKCNPMRKVSIHNVQIQYPLYLAFLRPQNLQTSTLECLICNPILCLRVDFFGRNFHPIHQSRQFILLLDQQLVPQLILSLTWLNC